MLLNRDTFFNLCLFFVKKGHAEKTPALDNDQERWSLPIFGVYHPKSRRKSQ